MSNIRVPGQIKTLVGAKECGCIEVAWPDLPEHEQKNIAAIDKWKRAGMSILYVEPELAHDEKCAQHRAEQQ